MERYIWDPFVRIFHWSLAIAFGVAFYNHASEWDRMIHIEAGYVAGALIVARIIWAQFQPAMPILGHFHLT